MSHVAVFHSVLGIRAGVEDAAERLRSVGHEVTVVDYYGGRQFDDYEEAGTYVDEVGFPSIIRRAAEAVEGVPDGLLVLGFSNGGGVAEAIALQRPVAGVVTISGALPVAVLGAASWPQGVPMQLHQTVDDPKRPGGWTDQVLRSVARAGADAELAQYPGSGHLFTDPSLPLEFDAEATERLWRRVLTFCGEHAR